MNIKTAVGAALLGIFWSSSMAFAFDTASKAPFGQTRESFAREFGKTLPPVGFVQFCVSNPLDCKGKGGKTFKLAMSPERWNLIYQVNAYVNGKIAPISDQDLYGEPERWAYPTDAGDCEDYLLLKKRSLQELGFPPEALLITVVLDEKNEGHAVLTVTTDGGDFILDNRRNDVLRWSDTDYTFLKRQSHGDPVQWVALVKQPSSNSGFVSGGTRH
ncbi:MAG: transglutaminase-like cysteine peptidase [Aestuariivirga sp.]|nr:transglutaminase-like cysteine peptidase [Aestuariivirga sp.]